MSKNKTDEQKYFKTLLGRSGSLVPSIEEDVFDENRTVFWEHEGNRAVRRGNWKLVSEFPGSWSSMTAYPHKGEWELYDLENDCTETSDLADKHPELVAELSALWHQWAERSNVVEGSLE